MGSLLIVFGFSWILVAAFMGLILGARHEPHVASLDALARNGDLHGYHRALDAYKWRVTVHAHGMLFPLVAIAIGFAIPKMTYPALVTDGLSVAMIIATVVWTIGGFKSSKLAMGAGDCLFVAGIVTTIIGLARSL